MDKEDFFVITIYKYIHIYMYIYYIYIIYIYKYIYVYNMFTFHEFNARMKNETYCWYCISLYTKLTVLVE